MGQPFVFVDCYLCGGERFLPVAGNRYLPCPLCEMDGCVMTRFPDGPAPSFIETVRGLIEAEHGAPGAPEAPGPEGRPGSPG